jgi:hypothetical protein
LKASTVKLEGIKEKIKISLTDADTTIDNLNIAIPSNRTTLPPFNTVISALLIPIIE